MSSVSCSVVTESLQPHQEAHQASLSMDSPGKNTGVGCHSLPQRIFLIQGSNPGLPQCRRILYHLNHQGRHFQWPVLFKLLMQCLWVLTVFPFTQVLSTVSCLLFQHASHHFYSLYKLFLNYFRGQWVYSWEDRWTGLIGRNESEIADLSCIFSFSQKYISAFSTKAVECDTSTVWLWLNSIFLPKWLLSSVKFSELSKNEANPKCLSVHCNLSMVPQPQAFMKAARVLRLAVIGWVEKTEGQMEASFEPQRF